MQNNNLPSNYPEDEIDLRDLLKTIFNSKKLIILITLAFALLAFIYIAEKEVKYQSTVIIEIGSYDLNFDQNGLSSVEKKLIEPVWLLIQKLKVNLIYKKQLGLDSEKLNFNSIENQLLEIKYTSPSSEISENAIKEAIIFVQETHTEILANIVNSLSAKIVGIDNKISAQENKIKYLLKLIPEEENNLLLLESNPTLLLQRASVKPTLQETIYRFKEEVITMQEEIKIEKQEKETVELQAKFINNQKNKTQPIRGLITSQIKPKQLFTILIGTIFGFIFSIFIVIVRQAFLKEQN